MRYRHEENAKRKTIAVVSISLIKNVKLINYQLFEKLSNDLQVLISAFLCFTDNLIRSRDMKKCLTGKL